MTKTRDRIVVACSCEGTVPIDKGVVGRACGGQLEAASHLCRRELDRFRRLVGTGVPITVGCTQEAPLFLEVAQELHAEAHLSFVNIRENAGWSKDAAAATPKMAALLAAASESAPPVPLVSLRSEGVALIYGRDEIAIEAARRLSDRLDVTVLLRCPGDIPPPRTNDFPVLKGTIAFATGHLGAFTLRVDDYAAPAPSSRRSLTFGEARDGATSQCDLVIDLSGGLPLFAAHEFRSGYLRADPRNALDVERVLFEAANLVGEFDKPRYVQFTEGLCAHSRSQITGCTRCIDLCPTGAITPAGDHVAIDPFVCAGCGTCAAVCPTGAASYTLPSVDSIIRKSRILIATYLAAGGRDAVVLVHDGDHGEALIEALARFGDGLPANVLPLRVNAMTQVGLELIAALFAYGAAGVHVLTRAKPKHDQRGLAFVVETSRTILEALGYGPAVDVVYTDDPDLLRAAIDAAPKGTPTLRPATFVSYGLKRGILELAFRELHRAAPTPIEGVLLGTGAPFGGLSLDQDACTLCLACVSACPTSALSDNSEKPMLRFTESLCVQCGLCASTCPEDAIGLIPRLDFKAWDSPRRILKEEEPFHCITCGKAFGTRSTIERIIQKLQDDQHWMFSGTGGADRTRILRMCEDCRVEAVVNESFDPHTVAERPEPRTTDNYRAVGNGSDPKSSSS
jgi:ferredoxin